MPQGPAKKIDRKRKLESEVENVHPNITTILPSAPAQPQSGGKSSKRAKDKKSRTSKCGKNNISKTPSESDTSSAANSNLSIRKLLENTRSDQTGKTADTNLKLNGYIESGREENDLNKTRPSLPISIPFDCLPGENVKKAMERVIVANLNHSYVENNDGSAMTGSQNMNKMNNDQVSVSQQSEINQASKTSVWTSANFVANSQATDTISSLRSNFTVDKMVIPKKRGQVLNGSINSTNDILKQTLVQKIDQSRNLKRKNQQEMDSVSKRLMIKGELHGFPGQVITQTSGSPETNTSTAMLISTANQPIAISAIPSPDLHGKNSVLKSNGKFYLCFIAMILTQAFLSFFYFKNI